jgi:hypothetical protein
MDPFVNERNGINLTEYNCLDLLLLQKMGPLVIHSVTAHQTNLKNMQSFFINCMRIFGIPVSVFGCLYSLLM